jgi:hypothetical protein
MPSFYHTLIDVRAGGVGIDLTRKVSLDVALFSATTNIERKRQAALASCVFVRFVSSWFLSGGIRERPYDVALFTEG